MSAFFHRHRALIGYVGIVLVAVLAIELHHYETTNEISDTSELACKASTQLASNQRVVIETLIVMISAESSEQEEHPELRAQLEQLVSRLKDIPRFKCRRITR